MMKSTLDTPPVPVAVESKHMDLDHEVPMDLDHEDSVVKLTAEHQEKLNEVFRELNNLQEQCDLLESKHMARINMIQASFEHNIQPLYSKRSSILAVENEKGLPNFWFTVMKEFRKMLNSKVELEVEFTDLDEAAFEYLKDIKYTPLDDEPKGWKLEFFFDSKSNPYFSNSILTKEAHYTRFRGRKVYNALKGTEIKWHSGKCLTQKLVKKLSKRYFVEIPSFFNLFGCNEVYDTHNELYESQAEIQRPHIQLCRLFIKILIPHPVSFYKEHMLRHHKVGVWIVKGPEDDSVLYQMGTDDPKFVEELGVKELHAIELNIQRLEASMLAAKQAAHEIHQLKTEPFYDRRSALIADILVGESTPIANPNSADEIIVGFWLNALRGEETLSEMISDHDAMVLLYLKDIRFSYLAGRKGWKLEFSFDSNPYFKNSVLTKEVHSLPSNGLCKTFSSTGAEIKWHPDGFLAVDNGQPIKSFFNLFNGCDDDGYDEEDLANDLQICNTIRFLFIIILETAFKKETVGLVSREEYVEKVVSFMVVYQKHHQTYVTNYNKALEQLDEAINKGDAPTAVKLQSTIKFNGGGHINHSIFWKNLAPTREGGGEPPQGSLGGAIETSFGSLEALIQKMNAEGAALQGSGWVWLAVDKELKRLVVETTGNQDPLLTKGASLVPLLGIDVWEHAYYLQNVRPDYLKNVWKVMNWKYAAEVYEKECP